MGPKKGRLNSGYPKSRTLLPPSPPRFRTQIVESIDIEAVVRVKEGHKKRRKTPANADFGKSAHQRGNRCFAGGLRRLRRTYKHSANSINRLQLNNLGTDIAGKGWPDGRKRVSEEF